MINKNPVHIRRNTETDMDAYTDEESLHDNSVCRQCGNVYMQGRWYTKGQLPEDRTMNHGTTDALCPACHRLKDRVPGGVLRLSGDFVWTHKDEILNLIHNETRNAQTSNPLEKVMSIESMDNVLEIKTTNDKLAQRIGKALSKAYSGTVEYKWTDSKLVRVNWHR